MPTSDPGLCVFVRFQGAILLAAVVAVGGAALEGSILDRRRSIGRQHYRLDVLRERVARLRLRSEELGSPSRLSRPAEAGGPGPASPRPSSALRMPPSPLLRWRAAPEAGR